MCGESQKAFWPISLIVVLGVAAYHRDKPVQCVQAAPVATICPRGPSPDAGVSHADATQTPPAEDSKPKEEARFFPGADIERTPFKKQATAVLLFAPPGQKI